MSDRPIFSAEAATADADSEALVDEALNLPHVFLNVLGIMLKGGRGGRQG